MYYLELKDKIPDPNETWSNFFKRVVNFELYQPPLVHKDTVTIDKRTGFWMRTQTKLLEIEYDKESIDIFT